MATYKHGGSDELMIGLPGSCKSMLAARLPGLPPPLAPDEPGRTLLTEAAGRLKLSARGYHRVLRVARTLADLEGVVGVKRMHVAEALSYRRVAPGR